MKKVFLLFIFIVGSILVSGQNRLPLTNDTIICIVDTTKCFTSFRENSFEKNPIYHWHVSIKGHYYDDKWPDDAGFASIGFSTNFKNKS